MLNEVQKYCIFECMYPPGGPYTWRVMDYDRRRVISLITAADCQGDPDVAAAHFERHLDILPPDTYQIHVSESGELLQVSTDPRDDAWICLSLPAVEELQLPKHLSIETILRTELCELSRISRGVDLVSYGTRQEKRVAFKYVLIVQNSRRFWSELNIWIRLSHHPNIVPFDRIVLDEIHGQIVGFTSLYIPGGTLEDNPLRGFKLKWLKQLIQVVDDLNLKYGVAHHKISARHLLIDPKTDNLLLIDFSFARRIADPVDVCTFDISGIEMALVILAVYSIITGDKSFHITPLYKKISNAAAVTELEEWIPSPGMTLDYPVSVYRSVLEEWVRRRQAAHTEALECIDWPKFPYKPPVWEMDEFGGYRTVRGDYDYDCLRSIKREAGRPTLDWERPPEISLQDANLSITIDMCIEEH